MTVDPRLTSTNEFLYVTSSGVVHRPECGHIQHPNSGAIRWHTRLNHDRPCSRCEPELPADQETP